MPTKNTLIDVCKPAKSQATAELPNFARVRRTNAVGISVRMRADILELIDALAKTESVTRTDAIELMLEFAFAERAARLCSGAGDE